MEKAAKINASKFLENILTSQDKELLKIHNRIEHIEEFINKLVDKMVSSYLENTTKPSLFNSPTTQVKKGRANSLLQKFPSLSSGKNDENTGKLVKTIITAKTCELLKKLHLGLAVDPTVKKKVTNQDLENLKTNLKEKIDKILLQAKSEQTQLTKNEPKLLTDMQNKVHSFLESQQFTVTLRDEIKKSDELHVKKSQVINYPAFEKRITDLLLNQNIVLLSHQDDKKNHIVSHTNQYGEGKATVINHPLYHDKKTILLAHGERDVIGDPATTTDLFRVSNKLIIGSGPKYGTSITYGEFCLDIAKRLPDVTGKRVGLIIAIGEEFEYFKSNFSWKNIKYPILGKLNIADYQYKAPFIEYVSDQPCTETATLYQCKIDNRPLNVLHLKKDGLATLNFAETFEYLEELLNELGDSQFVIHGNGENDSSATLMLAFLFYKKFDEMFANPNDGQTMFDAVMIRAAQVLQAHRQLMPGLLTNHAFLVSALLLAIEIHGKAKTSVINDLPEMTSVNYRETWPFHFNLAQRAEHADNVAVAKDAYYRAWQSMGNTQSAIRLTCLVSLYHTAVLDGQRHLEVYQDHGYKLINPRPEINLQAIGNECAKFMQEHPDYAVKFIEQLMDKKAYMSVIDCCDFMWSSLTKPSLKNTIAQMSAFAFLQTRNPDYDKSFEIHLPTNIKKDGPLDENFKKARGSVIKDIVGIETLMTKYDEKFVKSLYEEHTPTAKLAPEEEVSVIGGPSNSNSKQANKSGKFIDINHLKENLFQLADYTKVHEVIDADILTATGNKQCCRLFGLNQVRIDIIAKVFNAAEKADWKQQQPLLLSLEKMYYNCLRENCLLIAKNQQYLCVKTQSGQLPYQSFYHDIKRYPEPIMWRELTDEKDPKRAKMLKTCLDSTKMLSAINSFHQSKTTEEKTVLRIARLSDKINGKMNTPSNLQITGLKKVLEGIKKSPVDYKNTDEHINELENTINKLEAKMTPH